MFSMLVFASACGGKGDNADVEPPEYVEPTYAQGSFANVETTLRFTDVTKDAGVVFEHVNGAFGDKWMPETMGSGGGFFDYDGDGWPDILLVNGREWPGHETGAPPATARLYRNLGNGRFENVSRAAGLTFTVYGMGVTFADFDADGDEDAYVTALGDNLLLRNDRGVFRDVAAAMGVVGHGERANAPKAWSTGAAWVDVDRDGWPDVFVCNYVQWTPETDLFTTLDGVNKSYATPQQYEGESCRLYRNILGERFIDVTNESGVLNHDGKSLGVAVADFNDDLWPDLVVANDAQPNFLYLNQGDGTFEDVAVSAGVGFDEFGRARAGMGVDVADVNGDGLLSIAIGNFSREPLSLYTQLGSELFQDRAGSARLTRTTMLPLTFGVLFADLDLNGLPDLVLANGHIEPDINAVQQDVTFAQPPQVFLNMGARQFADVSAIVGPTFQIPIVARSVSSSDYDRDGDLDLLLTTNGSAPLLLRNDLGPETVTWMRVRLVGAAPNHVALGASVTVYAGPVMQRQMVRTGSSYLSQSEVMPMVFGLNGRASADSVVVRWPGSGRVDVIRDLPAGRENVIRESGSGSHTGG